jgi:hypothetical protein
MAAPIPPTLDSAQLGLHVAMLARYAPPLTASLLRGSWVGTSIGPLDIEAVAHGSVVEIPAGDGVVLHRSTVCYAVLSSDDDGWPDAHRTVVRDRLD